jgi:hypothetical protein
MNFNFNHSFVYWERVKDHQKYKKFILSQIFEENNNKAVLKKDFFTKNTSYKNYYMSIKYDENGQSGIATNPLVNYNLIEEEVVIPAVKRMIEEMGLNKSSDIYVKGIWCNYYESGGFHGVHHHEKSDISGIYILHLEEPNTTVFYNFTDCMLLPMSRTTEDIGEGSVILFPSHLLHEAKPSNKARVTLAFNLECDTNIYENIFQK